MKTALLVNIVALATLLAFPRIAFCDLRYVYFEVEGLPFYFLLLILLIVIAYIVRALEKYRNFDSIDKDAVDIVNPAHDDDSGDQAEGLKSPESVVSSAPPESETRERRSALDDLIFFLLLLILLIIVKDLLIGALNR